MKKKGFSLLIAVFILCFGLSLHVSARSVYTFLLGSSVKMQTVSNTQNDNTPETMPSLHSNAQIDLIQEAFSSRDVFPDYDKRYFSRAMTDDTAAPALPYKPSIRDLMKDFYKKAGSDDTAIFYYNGRSSKLQGLMLGKPDSYDDNYYPWDELMADLKTYAGQCRYVIVIADTSYSSLLLQATETNHYLSDYQNFLVLPACSENESEKYITFNGSTLSTGILTAAVYNTLRLTDQDLLYGDQDQNHVLTVLEFEESVRKEIQTLSARLGSDSLLHPTLRDLGFTQKSSLMMGETSRSLTNAVVTLDTDEYTCTDQAITPEVTVKLNGRTLVNEVDYHAEYSNNIKAGTGKITITGIGSFKDSCAAEFALLPGISLPEELTIPCGTSQSLQATVIGDDQLQITWSSSKPAVISVSKGTASALKEGKAVITASVDYNGKKIEASCKVTAAPKPPAIVCPGTAVKDGKYIYFAYEHLGIRMGIMRYNTKNNEIKEISTYKLKGERTDGFLNLSLKDDYIYTCWVQYNSPARAEVYIYRINKTTGKKKKLACGKYPVIAGNNIYYLEGYEGTYDGFPDTYYTGYIASMKLNGTKQKRVKYVDGTVTNLYTDGTNIYYSILGSNAIYTLNDVETDPLKGTFICNAASTEYPTCTDKFEFYVTKSNGLMQNLYRKNRQTGAIKKILSVPQRQSILNYRVLGEYIFVEIYDTTTVRVNCYTISGKLQSEICSWGAGE